MKIGVVGTGQIGSTLIRQYSSAGHLIKMTNASGPQKLALLVKETGAAYQSLPDTITDIDVLVIAIPLIEIPKLAKNPGWTISANTTIIDTTNYYPIRDGHLDELENGLPESIWVSRHLRHPVVKAYNSILYGSLAESGLPKGDVRRIALPVSGDNTYSKDKVARLINDSGFDTLDIGNLQESWRQQPGSPLYCTDLNLESIKKNLPKVKRELSAERRELALQFILQQNPLEWKSWWGDCVINNRRVYDTDIIN